MKGYDRTPELVFLYDSPQLVEHTTRLRVPGGWLVRTFYNIQSVGQNLAASAVFIPDPDGIWKFRRKQARMLKSVPEEIEDGKDMERQIKKHGP